MIPEDEGIYYESSSAARARVMPSSENMVSLDHGSSDRNLLGANFASSMKPRIS